MSPPPSRTLILEDGGGRLSPLGNLWPTSELLSGAQTSRQRLERRFGLAPGTAWILDRSPAPNASPGSDERLWATLRRDQAHEAPEPWLILNGRWPGLDRGEATGAATSLGLGQALAQDDGQILAARLAPSAVEPLRSGRNDGTWALPPGTQVKTLNERPLLDRPWDLLDRLEEALVQDAAESSLPLVEPTEANPAKRSAFSQSVRLGEHPIRIDPSAHVEPLSVLNAEGGPITIEAEARIGCFSLIQGPCHVGPGVQIQPHAWLRPGVSVGRGCVVGGEVSRSILHPWTNKNHAGYLGDALVGRWVNLGADTNVSNLKNTFGSVRVQLGEGKSPEPTGRTKLGPILGDFVCTGIGTRLSTGTVVACGAMLAVSGLVSGFVPPLSFWTDAQRGRYDPERFLRFVERRMATRGQTPSESLRARIRSLTASL